jgi:hypothetical protein
LPLHRAPDLRPRAAAALALSLTFAAAPCLAGETPVPEARVTLPPTPAWLPPHRDDTSHPTVLEAGRLLRDKLWRPAPPTPETRRELGLPMQRITNEDQGNITIARGDQGELDVNWEDPEELQNALLSIIESFYQNHPNRNPHFITVVTTFQVQSLAAFYMPLANDVRGIGYQHSGRGGEIFNYVGGGLALDGIIFMNNFRGYLGVYAPLGRLTFNQELGHRWGAHVAFQSRAGESMELLGRDCSHWSFFMDTNNSAMEGNRWVDNGNGTFETTTSFYDFGYSQLDRYLMGFAPAEAIRPFYFVSGAGAWNCAQQYRNGELNPGHYPPIFGGAGQDQVRVSGQRTDVTLDDVIAVEGDREPEYGAARNRWTMSYILAARRNDTVNERALQQVEDLRLEWERQWEQDATEPGYDAPDLVTTADGSNDPVEPDPEAGAGLGEACLAFRDCNPNETERCVGTNAGVGVCTKTCNAPADCPSDFCCVPSVPGPRQDRFDWYCMKKTTDMCEDYSQGGGEGGSGGAGGASGGGAEPPVGGSGGETGGTPVEVTPDAGAAVEADAGAAVDPGTGATVNKSGGGSSGCQALPGRPVAGAGLMALMAAGLLGARRRRARR